MNSLMDAWYLKLLRRKYVGLKIKIDILGYDNAYDIIELAVMKICAVCVHGPNCMLFCNFHEPLTAIKIIRYYFYIQISFTTIGIIFFFINHK